MRKHIQTLDPGDDYYVIDHNFGTPQVTLTLLWDDDGSMVGGDWCFYQFLPNHIDVQFHAILPKKVRAIVLGPPAPRELAPLPSPNSAQLDVIQERSQVMQHPAVKQYVADFQLALNLIQEYQRTLLILNSPDPSHVEAAALLRRYRMAPEKISEAFKIIADGVDITEHPDSVQSTAEEVVTEQIVDAEIVAELESGDE